MDNLRFYNLGRTVPQEALKTIGAGRLKGMSDINPMWRIKRLTEMFGPCGIGWWYEITDKHIVEDELTGQKAAFLDILLFYKDPATGETSHGVPGTGGSSFVAQEKNGKYLSDECFKMALTDAISVAAKAIGVAADVYYAKDRSKYDQAAPQTPPSQSPEVVAYDAAMQQVKDLIEKVVDETTANANAPLLKQIKHSGNSERDGIVLWNRKIKELGLIYDTIVKAYAVKV